MAIHTYLDVSTKHVTKEEMEAISGYGDSAIPVSATQTYGAWLYVPDIDEDTEADRRQRFPNLQAIIELARERGARYVNLDADGDTEDSLAAFDW